jgi:hypothetical protein
LRVPVHRTTLSRPFTAETLMRQTRHFVEWHGVRYTAEPLRTHTRVSSLPPVWAVSRGQEFIGTLPMRPEENTKEFEVRCATWLQDLLGPSKRMWNLGPEQSSR